MGKIKYFEIFDAMLIDYHFHYICLMCKTKHYVIKGN